MQKPENIPAVEDAGTIGEETVFVETPEHAAERLGDEDARQASMLRHPSNSLKEIFRDDPEGYARVRAAGIRDSIDDPDELLKLRTATGQLYTDQPSVAFHEQAILAVIQENYDQGLTPPHRDDLFVVWFVKVLGNWKALVGQKSSTNYYEVTFNGAKQEAYVDRYVKQSNTVVPANAIEINYPGTGTR